MHQLVPARKPLAARKHNDLQPPGCGRNERIQTQMPTITPIDPAHATGKAKQLLDAVKAKLGITPNLMKTFANSPAALEGYLNFSGALSSGLLDAKFREQIALAVAQANSCEYCLSAHTVIGGMVGLKPEEIQCSRASHSIDASTNAGLQFAQAIVVQRGEVSASAVENVRKAGYSDGEI